MGAGCGVRESLMVGGLRGVWNLKGMFQDGHDFEKGVVRRA